VRQSADGGIDSSDTYTSPWLGTPTKQSQKTLASGTAYVIGVHGRRGAVIDALGLVTSSDGRQ
jgi:hypothetical protein